MLTVNLISKFEEIIGIKNIDLSLIDHIVSKDANILRPIKGVAFEVYFEKILKQRFNKLDLRPGVGDSDIDLILNNKKLQLKTIDNGSTVSNKCIGVALHKTHGNETRPNNLYSRNNKTFDFLVVLHPVSGILIIPFEEIPKHNSYPSHLADPAIFSWNSKWINQWELVGINKLNNLKIDDRTVPKNSRLPFLSSVTFLEDFEIIEMMSRPEYFRATVMGLKGNIKQYWFLDELKKMGLSPSEPEDSYAKYDVVIQDKNKKDIRIQVKGTTTDMCDVTNSKIGVEVMSTHGQFPARGYKKTMFDYVAIIILESQLPQNFKGTGLHFILIPMGDLPLHYKIGSQGDKDAKWRLPEYSDVIYPNIKLRYKFQGKDLLFFPDLGSYNPKTIPTNSAFKTAGPYALDSLNIPNLNAKLF